MCRISIAVMLVLLVLTSVNLQMWALGENDDMCSYSNKCNNREGLECDKELRCCTGHRYAAQGPDENGVIVEETGICKCCKKECKTEHQSQADEHEGDKGSYLVYCNDD